MVTGKVFDMLNGGRFYLGKPEFAVNAFNFIGNIVAKHHIFGGEIAHTFHGGFNLAHLLHPFCKIFAIKSVFSIIHKFFRKVNKPQSFI